MFSNNTLFPTPFKAQAQVFTELAPENAYTFFFVLFCLKVLHYYSSKKPNREIWIKEVMPDLC